MFATATRAHDDVPFLAPAAAEVRGAPAGRRGRAENDATHARRIGESLALIAGRLPIERRILRAGAAVYRAGQRFTHLLVINAGCFKIVNLSADGREQIVSLKFRGDWLGFDGIAEEVHECDAIAMDTGEVWAIPYAALLHECTICPSMMGALHGAMAREIARDRNSLMSVCSLPADARVAEFLHDWARSLARRGLRTDQITMRMTRAEIGNYVGVTLETVSRGLSRLARCGLIEFVDKGRREIRIRDVDALGDFARECIVPAPMLQ